MEQSKFYDVQKITVEESWVAQALDDYECFGWTEDESASREESMGKVTLCFRRDRRIVNKTELTRLQRHYEACIHEIMLLEASRQGWAMFVALGCGLIGCGFMAGSVVAVAADPPLIWLSIPLGFFGFALWLAGWIGYHVTLHKRTERVTPLIEQKYDEACEVCERAGKLL